MPLIVVCGMPCSGKTRLTHLLSDYLIQCKQLTPITVSDERKLNDLKRNELYVNAGKEKQLRAWVKSEAERHLSADQLVIIDALNYIKGYRYELYCVSKERKTTHCVVECVTPIQLSFEWNLTKNDDSLQTDSYDKQTFDALVERYEAPDSRNRWDSPLFVVNGSDEIPFEQIVDSLYKRKAPPPNKSTQSQPLASGQYVFQLDSVTQQVVNQIATAVHNGQLTGISIANANEHINMERALTRAELSKLRRQFINYIKMHPISDTEQIINSFVQYLNKSM